MFKSLFSKYFSVISLIILSSFLIMTCLQLVLFTRSIAEEKRVLLTENANNIANHTKLAASEAMVSMDGTVVYHLDQNSLSPFLNLIGNAIDATVLVTDNEGTILLSSEGRHAPCLGSTALAAVVPEVDEGYYTVSTLGNLYSTRQITRLRRSISAGGCWATCLCQPQRLPFGRHWLLIPVCM